jgi:hypothetical protein
MEEKEHSIDLKETIGIVEFVILDELKVSELANRPDEVKTEDEDIVDRVRLLMMNILVDTIDIAADEILKNGKDALPSEKELKRQLKEKLEKPHFT